MAGVREQINRGSGQVSAAAALPESSPAAFGAGIGDALAAVGSELEASSRRAMEVERQRKREAAIAQAGVDAAQLSINLNHSAQAARDQAPLDGGGHVERVTQESQSAVDAFLGTIADPHVRDQWRARAASMRGNVIEEEDGWARGRRIEAIGTNIRDAGKLWDNQLQGNPDAQVFSQSIDSVDQVLEGVSAPADVKLKLGTEQKASRAQNYARGLIEKDPASALAVLGSGALDQWLQPDDKKVLTNEAQTGVRVLLADQKRQVSQAASLVHVDAQGLNSAIERGDLPDDKAVDGVIARARALQTADPGLKNVADTLEYNRGKLKLSRLTDKWTTVEWAQAVDPLAAKVAQGKASDDEQLQLRILQELRPAKEARFRNDPDGFSAASGIPPPQVDLGNPDAGTVQARKSWAKSFARTGGLVEAPYLNRDQLQEYRDRVAQSPVAAFDVAQELKGTWGMDAAPSIVRQIGGPAKGDMQLMLGLDPAIAQRYSRGRAALDKKAVDVNEDVARQVYGAYVRAVPSDLQGPMFEAARNIAAGWMLEKGFTKAPANFDQVFRAALQYAAGRSGNVNDFNSPGGLAELNGRYAWLPGDMSSNDFLRRVSRAQPQDWVNAAVDPRGNPVKAVPHYIGPDGKPKPYTKGDALNFAKGTLQTLDQGLYHLVDRFGHTVVDEHRAPWTFDVRRLP